MANFWENDAPAADEEFWKADKPAAQRDLPAGVKPSQGGAGRGMVVPTRPPAPREVIEASDPMGTGAAEIMAQPPRRESVLEGLVLDEPKFDPAEAERLSRRDYAERTPGPGDPRLTAPTVKEGAGAPPITLAEDVGRRLQDAPAPVRAVGRMAAAGAEQLGGLTRAAGEAAGSSAVADFGTAAGRGAEAMQRTMGDAAPSTTFGPKSPVPYVQDMTEGAAASLGQSAMLAGSLGAKAVIPAMSVLSAGAEYQKAREQGKDPLEAFAGAVPKGAFEAIGEKFQGLDRAAAAMGTLLNKGASDMAKREAGQQLLRAGVREIPGEVVTYLGQTGVDLLPGIGLNPNLTVDQFLNGLRDTVVQSAIMGGAMGLGGVAAARTPRPIGDLAKEKGVSLEASPEELARVQRLQDAGEKDAAGVLQARLDRTLAQRTTALELEALASADPVGVYANPTFQQGYTELRAGGAKPAEAAARAAALAGFDAAAAAAGMPENFKVQALEAARNKPIAEMPGFLQKFLGAVVKRGRAQPVEDVNLEQVADEAMDAVMSTVYADPTPADTASAIVELEKAMGEDAAVETVSPEASAAPETVGSAPVEGGFVPPNDPIVSAGGTGLEDRAHAAATSPTNDRPEPTDAQKKAGNYPLGHARIAGMDVSIENPQGSTRRGTSPDGTAWETPMKSHYGYFKGTTAADGDKLDVFIKPLTPTDYAGPVFVVDQVNPDGAFDEHKVLMGFDSEAAARAGYLENYEPGWTGLGAITQLPMDAFRSWARDGAKKKPLGALPTPAQDSSQAKPASSAAPGPKVANPESSPQDSPLPTDARTPAQRRIGLPRTSPAGEPIPAHALIAAEGGLAPAERADMNVGDNPRVGNRRLFAAAGRGMTIEQALEKLVQAGYLTEGASQDQARALIARSLTTPQYTPADQELLAEREKAQSFETFLEQADPFAPPDDYTESELDAAGYTAASDEVKAEVQALLAMAEAQGIDTESIREDAARLNPEATEQDYYDAAKSALEEALAGSEGNRGAPAGQEGRAAGSGEEVESPAAAPAAPAVFALEVRPSGTLAVKGNADQILARLKEGGITKTMPMNGGIMVGKTQAQRAKDFLEGKPEPKAAPKPLAVGTSPGDAQPVTVKDGVIHVGRHEAIDFDSGDPITVPEAASEAQIREALRKGGALSARQRFYGGANVAMEEGAVYTVNEPQSNYDVPLDLFPDSLDSLQGGQGGAALRKPTRGTEARNVPAEPVLAVRQDDGFPGLYHVSTQLVQVGERTLPVSRVQSWDDAAAAMSAMSRFAVEHLDALVTDADGKPLALVANFKGGTTSATVNLDTLMFEAMRIKGAAKIWLAHNHPSGRATLSDADKQLSGDIDRSFEPSGIRFMGLAAVVRRSGGAVAYEAILPDDRIRRGEVLATGTAHKVPVVEREVTGEATGLIIKTPEHGVAAARVIAGSESGILFLGPMFEVNAWVPIKPDVAKHLRVQDRFQQLIASASQAGSVNAVIVNPDDVLGDGARNLGTALSKAQVRIVDIVDTVNRRSAAKEGTIGSMGGTVFARVPNADLLRRTFGVDGAPMPVAEVQKIVEDLTKGWKNAPPIRVVSDYRELPVAAPDDAVGLYANGQAWIVARTNRSRDRIARTLAHEVVAHYGLRQILDDGGFERFQKNMQLAIDAGNKPLNAARDWVRKAYVDSLGNFTLNAADEADEIAARVIEQAVDPKTGEFRTGYSWLKEVWARVADFLRRMGITVKFTNAELHGMLVQAQKNLQTGKKFAGGGEMVLAARSNTPVDLADVVIGHKQGAAQEHADYAAAKAGNREAALRLARDMVDDPMVEKVRAAIGDSKPLVVGVAAEEAAGRNKIPVMVAEVLASRLGLETSTDLVQANRARRSSADGLDRLFANVDFDGKVEPRDYVIIDDTLTQGGTLAALADHIRAGGGRVAATVALTGKNYSARIRLSPETLASLREKFPDLEADYRAATGRGFDALTESEARFILKFKPADALRARFAAERDAARQRLGEEGTGEGLTTAHARARGAAALLAEQFREATGDNIEVAGTRMAGVKLRNEMRADGTAAGSPATLKPEPAPYTDEQVAMIERWEAMRHPSSKYLFHTTPAANLASIAKSGLTTGNKPRFEGVSSSSRTSFAGNEEVARYYGGDGDVMLRVSKDHQFDDLEADMLAGDGAYTTGKTVPPAALQVKVGRKWVPLSEAVKESKVTESASFKAWFGDSKVVDADGKPLVMYHGTTNLDQILKSGFKKGWTHLTDSKPVADSYQEWDRGGHAGTLDLYVKAENPAYFDAEGKKYTDIGNKVSRATYDAEKAGHDALIITNIRDNYDSSVAVEPHTTVVAFKPEQIKSATGNRGTFDPQDPNILFARSGERATHRMADQLRELAEEEGGENVEVQLVAATEPNRNAAQIWDHDGPEFWLQWLESTEKGAGARALEALLNAADERNAVIRADVEDDGSGKLFRYYERFGFRRDPAGSNIIERPPHGDWSMVESSDSLEEFMGQSQVTENGRAGGKPLVVYHGGAANIDEFKTPAYFTTNQEDAGEYGDNVDAFYLHIARPHRGMDVWDSRSDALTPRKIAQLEKQGFDGIEARDRGTGSVHYIAFHPSQIRRASDFGGAGGLFARAGQEDLFAPAPWAAPEPTKTDRVIYELQDGRVDLKRTQEAIAKAGREITEQFDARLAETLYPGRVARRSDLFLDREVKPLLEAMAREKVGMDELADYLHARGASERNAQVAKVNSSMPDGGAGTNTKGVLMTNDAAAEHLAALPAERRATLAKLAEKVDTITAGTRGLLVAEGLEKADTIAAWEGAYKNYVPMFRDEAESGVPHPQGMGFSVKGPASKRVTGSTKQVTNILAHVLMQREAAITRAEKNRVGMALYGMALSHPNPEFWTTIRPGMKAEEIGRELTAMGVDPTTAEAGMQGVPTITTVDPVLGKKVSRPNPMYKNLPGAVALRVNGEDRVIMFNQKNERALRLAENMKNMDDLTMLDLAGSIVGKATRWMAAINTQYNPAFGLVNLTRDVQGALINLGSTPLRGQSLKVLAKVPGAMRGIWRGEREKDGTDWTKLYEQFQNDGGKTGYRDLWRDPNERAKAIEDEVKKLEKAGKFTPGAAAHAVLDLLDGFNTTLENAVRVAAYKVGVDSGMSRPAAAKLGRELTVDFNRKGRAGRELGPLYAFFNASIQGTARTIQTLKGPTGAKVIAGGLAIGALQAILLAAAGYEDDEIPEYVKARALILPLPGSEKKYIAIPLPLGLHVIPNTGRVIAELSLNGGKNLAKRAVDAVGEIAGAMSPLGGGNLFTADGVLRLAAPTVVDPLIEIGFNKNFAGTPIERQSLKGENENRPGYARARESTQRSLTGQAYLGISKALNTLSGGSPYEAGKVSPTPERVRYLAQVAGGGVLRELEKGIDSTAKAIQGEKVKPSGVPVAGRFFGEVDEDRVQMTRYFERGKRLDQLETSLNAMKKAGDGAAMEKLLAEHPEAQLIRFHNKVQSNIAKLNRVAATTIDDVEALKDLDAARQAQMRELNEAIRELEAAPPTLAQRLRGTVTKAVAGAEAAPAQ